MNITPHDNFNNFDGLSSVFFTTDWLKKFYVEEARSDPDLYMEHLKKAHVTAGILSALLLTAAIVICSCVVIRKR